MQFFFPQPVLEALDALEKAGFAAYAVGGCVRDQVLGAALHDYDICTAATPPEMQAVFRDRRTLETGLRHGTLTVLIDGMPLEITTFRVDGEYLDGRRPEHVAFTDRIEEDLARRDFTINAMAYSPLRGLADPFGGQEDCQRGVIRCVGAPEKRFEEDALRILRALRFSARLGFPIEELTARALHDCRGGLRRISRERIAAELNGLLLGSHPGPALSGFPDVIGEALAPGALPENWPLAIARTLLVPPELALRWAALLLDTGAEEAHHTLKALKTPVRLQTAVRSLVAGPGDQNMPLREMLMRMGPDNLSLFLSLRQADRQARRPEETEKARAEAVRERAALQKLLDENACWSLNQLAVGGSDLAEMGFVPGPDIGAALQRLLLLVVREQLPNEREALLNAARAFLTEK